MSLWLYDCDENISAVTFPHCFLNCSPECVWSGRLECPDSVVWPAHVCVWDGTVTQSHLTTNCHCSGLKSPALSAETRHDIIQRHFWEKPPWLCSVFLKAFPSNTDRQKLSLLLLLLLLLIQLFLSWLKKQLNGLTVSYCRLLSIIFFFTPPSLC